MLLSQPIISAFDIVSPPAICASSRFSPSAVHMHPAQYSLVFRVENSNKVTVLQFSDYMALFFHVFGTCAPFGIEQNFFSYPLTPSHHVISSSRVPLSHTNHLHHGTLHDPSSQCHLISSVCPNHECTLLHWWNNKSPFDSTLSAVS